MRLGRLRLADWLTAASGLALLALLWAPWYATESGELSGWRAFTVLDLWLALTAALAVAVALVTAARDAPALPVAMDVLCWTAALVALVGVAVRLLAEPHGDIVTGRAWGAAAGAAAVAGVFAGAWWAMRDESAPGLRPAPEVRTLRAPPPGMGPEPVQAET